MEEWRDIKGFEGLYQVSNIGNVRSVERVIKTDKGARHYKSVVLKIGTKSNGYRIVHLYNKCECRTFHVHRLVAEAFIPNPENLPCVNHKDGNRKNNVVENLEWCTQKDNLRYAVEKGKLKLGKPEQAIKSTSKRVMRNDGEVFSSASEAARQIGAGLSSVSRVCNGKRKTILGYSFRYID